MIIKSNLVTEVVSAVDRHQLHNLITPQGEKRDPFPNALDVHQFVIFIVQKSYSKCPQCTLVAVCVKPELVRTLCWFTTQQSMQLVILTSHSK